VRQGRDDEQQLQAGSEDFIVVIADDSKSALVHDLLKATLASEGVVRVRATGTSMLPSIWPGDHVIIERVSRPVSAGSVVAYLRNGRLFIHRVFRVSRDSNELLTQGDRLPAPDAPINAGDLLGVVTGLSRGGAPAAMPARLLWRAHLLRAISRVSDTPAFAIVKLRRWYASRHLRSYCRVSQSLE